MKTGFRILFSAFIFSLTLISCKKEGCTDSSALNYDSEAKKACDACCQADPRGELIGSYWVTQDQSFAGGAPVTSNYILLVSKDPTSSSKVILANMFNSGNDYSATLSGNNFSFTNNDFPGATATGAFGTNNITYSGQSDIFTYTGTGTK